jgi:hypothetical protein
MKNISFFLFLITPFFCHGQFKVEYVIAENDTLSIAITQFPNGELIGGAYFYKIINDEDYNSSSFFKFSKTDSTVTIKSVYEDKFYLDTFEINKGNNTFPNNTLGKYLLILKEGSQKDTINRWLQSLIQPIAKEIEADSINHLLDLSNGKTNAIGQYYIKEILIGLLIIMLIILWIQFKKERGVRKELKAELDELSKSRNNDVDTSKNGDEERSKSTKKIDAAKKDLISDDANELKSIQLFLFKVDNVLSENHLLVEKLSSQSFEMMNPKLVGFQKKHEHLKKYWEAVIENILSNKSIKDENLRKSIEGIVSNNEKVRIIKNKLYVDFLIDYVNDFFILLEEYRISEKLNYLTELNVLSSKNEGNIKNLLKDVKEFLLFNLHYTASLTKFDSKNSKHIKLLNYDKSEKTYNNWIDNLTIEEKDGFVIKIENFGNSFNNSKTILLIT